MASVNEKEAPQTQSKILKLLPSSLLPYAELARIHRLLGLYLNTSPYFVGIAFTASIAPEIPVSILLHRLVLFSIWSFFLRCAGCVWNDLIDSDLDAQIARTKSRPLPRGAISKRNAAIFTVTLFACGSSVLLFLPSQCTIEAIIKIFFALLYPFGKRFSDYPQVILGNIGWAIPMTMHSLGVDPLQHLIPTVCMFFFIATVIIMVDVVYACQDTEEDLKVGVKSMAVRFRNSIPILAYGLFYISTALFASVGLLTGLGLPFFVVSVGGHFVGFNNLLKATQIGKSSGLEHSAKVYCLLSSIFWVLGFGIEYCLRGN
ncbi:hypothetical protein N7517_003035 [Penicillium concentricum]|uniref:UbiA prenyltransferase n=1 Tax=Penicillium concentricum TaxID=293559 RepID=A0A9W9SWK1_9EURO|nr:uncharacterized protein N7517_003035 [Penicillium concentricum]KAJ5385124.1 hypothetical protein N7517_003035 [Penicillium concentricum]